MSASPEQLRARLAAGEVDLDDAALRRAAISDPGLARELEQMDLARQAVEAYDRERDEVLEAVRSPAGSAAEEAVRQRVLDLAGQARAQPPRTHRRARRALIGLAAAAALVWIGLLTMREPDGRPDPGPPLGAGEIAAIRPLGELRATSFGRFEFDWTGPSDARRTFLFLVYDAQGREIASSAGDDPDPSDTVWTPSQQVTEEKITWRVEVRWGRSSEGRSKRFSSELRDP